MSVFLSICLLISLPLFLSLALSLSLSLSLAHITKVYIMWLITDRYMLRIRMVSGTHPRFCRCIFLWTLNFRSFIFCQGSHMIIRNIQTFVTHSTRMRKLGCYSMSSEFSGGQTQKKVVIFDVFIIDMVHIISVFGDAMGWKKKLCAPTLLVLQNWCFQVVVAPRGCQACIAHIAFPLLTYIF